MNNYDANNNYALPQESYPEKFVIIFYKRNKNETFNKICILGF